MDKDQEIIDAAIAASYLENGWRRLSCSKAFEIAKRLGVPVSKIGQICNEQNISISACQLGCFK